MRWQLQLGDIEPGRSGIGKRLVDDVGFHEIIATGLSTGTGIVKDSMPKKKHPPHAGSGGGCFDDRCRAYSATTFNVIVCVISECS